MPSTIIARLKPIVAELLNDPNVARVAVNWRDQDGKVHDEVLYRLVESQLNLIDGAIGMVGDLTVEVKGDAPTDAGRFAAQTLANARHKVAPGLKPPPITIIENLKPASGENIAGRGDWMFSVDGSQV